MIDIVCPLGNGSKWMNNELRYSLRSLEKFGKNIGEVFIVGEFPEWLQYCEHIPVKDGIGHEKNIMLKLLAACNDDRVSENFMLWNDDYFLTAPINCELYPNYECGSLAMKIEARIKEDGYRKSLENTRTFLTRNNKWTLMYDGHCPIIYNKTMFRELMNNVDWTIGNGYAIKSLYANYYALPHQYMDDLKFSERIGESEIYQKINGRHIFSIADGVMFCPSKTMKNILEKLYPNPSKYER